MSLAQAIATCRVQLATRVAENVPLPSTVPTSPSRTVANGRPTHGRQRPLSAMPRWKMPSKRSQVAKARDIDGELVVSHEGRHKGAPKRTVAGSKDPLTALPIIIPREATEAMETHPI